MFESRVFHLAKDVEFADEYEDSFHLDPERGIAAIADGVSSAIFSRQWADILTRGVVQDPPNLLEPNAFSDWLANRRAAWLERIDVNSLPWNQKQKLRQVGGGFSTLLWIEVVPDEPEKNAVRCRGFAVGDCCLFHVRDDAVLSTFPIQDVAEFDADPLSISSANASRDHLLEFRALDESCRPGDLLVLATDAFAKWAMTRLASGEPPAWSEYWTMSEEDWAERIVTLRRANQIRYDDTTLVLLRLSEVASVPFTSPEPAAEGADPRASESLPQLGERDEESATDAHGGAGAIRTSCPKIRNRHRINHRR